MKIELSNRELEEAIQDYMFKKLGDTAYINGFTGINGSTYLDIDCVEVYVKE